MISAGLLAWIGISKAKYYQWTARMDEPNRHNGAQKKSHWLLPSEEEAIIRYAKEHWAEQDYHLQDGYRRLSYRMLDQNIVATSASTVYRLLKRAGLLNRWNTNKRSSKGHGFIQPKGSHEHWHTDIKYVNFKGTFLFLISVLDGFSRYILHHELRTCMNTYDVELTIEAALDKYPGAKPRIISDNGPQYISKDFNRFIKLLELVHIRTSIAYPQSNGKIERFHRSINEECLQTSSFIDLNDAKSHIAEYIQRYNTQRLHGALYYLTPEDVFNGRTRERLDERKLKLTQATQKRKEYWQKNVA